MKKFLSLMLAMIMVMSLVTVGAGAVDFTDEETIQYNEAVAVMSELGILTGTKNADGTYTFYPQGTLTRQAAAKIIAYIALGADDAEDLVCVEDPFTDVPATKTLAPYINWAAKEGIITGYDDGTFKPSNNVSGHAFLKMVLGALGIEGTYEGEGWRVNVTSAAAEAGLFDGIDTTAIDLRKDATRELACQIAFNAMFYSEEEPETKYIVYKGEEVYYEGTNQTLATVAAIANEGATLLETTAPADGSFAKENFKLEPSEGRVGNYDRPATIYTYGDDADQVIVDKAPYKVFTNGVTEKELFAALGFTKVADELTLNVITDGETETASTITVEKNSTDAVAEAGARVEIYKVDGEKKVFDVVVIQNHVKKLTSDFIKAEVKATATKDAVPAYIIVEGAKTLAYDEVGTFETAAFKKNDIIIYTKDAGEITSVVKAGSITKAAVTKYTEDSVTFDGITYGYAGNLLSGSIQTGYDFEKTYTFYLDAEGNVVGNAATSASTIKDYAYVTSIQAQGYDSTDLLGSGSEAVVVAEVIFTDGSKKVVDVKVAKNSDGKYVYAKPGAPAEGKTVGSVTANTEVVTTVDGDGKAAAEPVGEWFAYKQNEDGTYTFSAISTSYANVVVGGKTLLEGKAATLGGKYTTAGTTIVAIDDEQNVGKTTGLVDLILTGKVLYTYSSSSSKTVAAIYAVEQESADLGVTTDYVYFLEEGAKVKDGVEWIVAEDGKEVTYIVDVELGADLKGAIATLVINEDGVATPYEIAGTVTVENVEIILVDEDYMVTNYEDEPVLYFADKFAAYDVMEDATAGELAEDLICTMLIKGNEVIAVYVTGVVED